MRHRTSFLALLLLGVGLVAADATARAPRFTVDFNIEDSPYFVPDGGTRYFSLEPGRFFRYEGRDEEGFIELEIRVVDESRVIRFEVEGERKIAVARVIEEREWVDGELIEVSRNYLARCPVSNNIFFFGESVDLYENGEVVSHDGSWIAGQNRARPGLFMPGVFLLGARYYQELAPPDALDRGENVDMNVEVSTPAGTFEDCVVVEESSPLDPGDRSIKIYAPNVGMVVDDSLRLVEHR